MHVFDMDATIIGAVFLAQEAVPKGFENTALGATILGTFFVVAKGMDRYFENRRADRQQKHEIDKDDAAGKRLDEVFRRVEECEVKHKECENRADTLAKRVSDIEAKQNAGRT